MKIALVYTTVPSQKTAVKMASYLIEKRLAFCANLIESGTSLFFWKNKLHQEPEVFMLIKTHPSQLKTVTKHIKKNHPYQAPAIFHWICKSHDSEYNEWARKWLGS